MSDWISGVIFAFMLVAAWHFIFGPWWRKRKVDSKTIRTKKK